MPRWERIILGLLLLVTSTTMFWLLAEPRAGIHSYMIRRPDMATVREEWMVDVREYYWQTAHSLRRLTVIMDCNDQFLAEYHPISPSLENLEFLGPDNCTSQPGNLHHNCQCYLQLEHLTVDVNYTDASQLSATDVTDC